MGLLGRAAFLTFLYFLQGIPLGLVLGSLPLLYAAKISYSEQSLFSLAGYPYSLKLFWSPIVDACYSRELGRRKTWILPIQVMLGVLFYLWREDMDMDAPGATVADRMWKALALVLLAATQDIAVDGWSLELLPKDSVALAGYCQSIGLSLGFVISYTLLMTMTSWGYWTLSGFLSFFSFVMLFSTVIVFLAPAESNHRVASDSNPSSQPEIGREDTMSVAATYRSMVALLRTWPILQLTGILLFSRFVFAPSDVSAFKLREKGLSNPDMALLASLTFPFEFLWSFVISKMNSRPGRELLGWRRGYLLRLVCMAIEIYIVYGYPVSFSWLLAMTLFRSFAGNYMIVSQSCFFASIADASIGGTYLTLLNTLSNLGGTWPRSAFLFALGFGEDGFFPLSLACLVAGVFLYLMWVRGATSRLMLVPRKAWSLPGTS